MNSFARFCITLLVGLGLPGYSFCSNRSKDDGTQDRIRVLAHLPIAGGPVQRFLVTRHHSRDYLYAEGISGKTATLIDITKPGSPKVLAEVEYPDGEGADSLVAVTGNAALVSDGSTEKSDAFRHPSTIRIMNFSNPAHPAVQQEFQRVTAMQQDDRHGLIFLANSDGVWILQQQYGEDPEAEARWEHDVLGAR